MSFRIYLEMKWTTRIPFFVEEMKLTKVQPIVVVQLAQVALCGETTKRVLT